MRIHLNLGALTFNKVEDNFKMSYRPFLTGVTLFSVFNINIEYFQL